MREICGLSDLRAICAMRKITAYEGGRGSSGVRMKWLILWQLHVQLRLTSSCGF